MLIYLMVYLAPLIAGLPVESLQAVLISKIVWTSLDLRFLEIFLMVTGCLFL